MSVVNAALAESDDPKASPSVPNDLRRERALDEDTLKRQTEYLARDSFVLKCETNMKGYGQVRPSEPHVVYIALEVVDSVGQAYGVRQYDPNLSKRSILFLTAIVIGALVHSMRLSGVGLRDTADYHAVQLDEGYWSGESGCMVERALFGGRLAPITSTPGFMPTLLNNFPGQILELRLQRDVDHFAINPDDIDRIVSGRQAWESVLPFQPSAGSPPVVPGICDWPELGTANPHDDAVTPAPLPSFSPPHHSPTRCLYTEEKKKWKAEQKEIDGRRGLSHQD